MKKQTYISIFISFLFINIAFGQTLEDDRQALIALYSDAGGSSWYNDSGWNVPGNFGDDPCGWFGIGCTGERVTNIDLTDNNLIGNIPREIGDLSNLEVLVLRGNKLTGNIPVEIGDLSNLEILWLQFNELSGSIPNSITNLSSLTYLHLRSNMLSGSIPSTINNLTNLEFLWIGGNPLTGQLPTELGMLPNLKELRIAFCSLDGPIPTSLQNLTNLTSIDLRNNMLSGTIPPGLANINTFHTLAVEDNQLSGPIPDFSGLPGMNTLWLRFNRFTFEGVEENLFVPSYLYNSQALIPISLTGNELSVSAGGNLCNNSYYWYKVGTGLVATVNNCTESYIPSVPGDYYVQVTNSGISNFTLTSEVATVTCIPELCDNIDNDCDGLIDEDFDLDGDGVTSCGGDCDDNDPNNFPGNIEVCDGKDNNCDGNIDDSIDPDPIASLYNLISIVQSLGLSQDDEEKLTDKLNNAIMKLNSGNESGAIGSITGFIGQVGAFVSNGKLIQDDGDLLVSIANCIINSINNNQNLFDSGENPNVPTQLSRTGFDVFPNPTIDHLNIDLHNYLEQEMSISIYNHLGQQVWSLPEQKLENPILNIKLGNYQLPEGIYLLSVRTDERRQAKQFIISK